MLTLSEWLKERLTTCQILAARKAGDEYDGWIEDANYFRQAIASIEELGRLKSALSALKEPQEQENLATARPKNL
jgi:hypothetical protein